MCPFDPFLLAQSQILVLVLSNKTVAVYMYGCCVINCQAGFGKNYWVRLEAYEKCM